MHWEWSLVYSFAPPLSRAAVEIRTSPLKAQLVAGILQWHYVLKSCAVCFHQQPNSLLLTSLALLCPYFLCAVPPAVPQVAGSWDPAAAPVAASWDPAAAPVVPGGWEPAAPTGWDPATGQ